MSNRVVTYLLHQQYVDKYLGGDITSINQGHYDDIIEMIRDYDPVDYVDGATYADIYTDLTRIEATLPARLMETYTPLAGTVPFNMIAVHFQVERCLRNQKKYYEVQEAILRLSQLMNSHGELTFYPPTTITAAEKYEDEFRRITAPVIAGTPYDSFMKLYNAFDPEWDMYGYAGVITPSGIEFVTIAGLATGTQYDALVYHYVTENGRMNVVQKDMTHYVMTDIKGVVNF